MATRAKKSKPVLKSKTHVSIVSAKSFKHQGGEYRITRKSNNEVELLTPKGITGAQLQAFKDRFEKQITEFKEKTNINPKN